MTTHLNYFKIIHAYIPPESETYQLYLPHVVMVTQKALTIARRLNLDDEQIQFILEASMLHDIGICRVNAPKLGCHGTLPYICHGTEGQKILESEGYPKHAQVATHHTGVGITKAEIISLDLPLEHQDFIPETIEQEIIAYSDIWFSKNPDRLWQPYTVAEVKEWMSKFSDPEGKIAKFEGWMKKFESH